MEDTNVCELGVSDHLRHLRNLWMSCFWISNDHSSTDYADDADDKKQEPTLKRKTTKVISTWGKRGATEVVTT
jgi:hypothetical protein